MGGDTYFKLIRTVRLDLLDLFGSGYIIEHCVAALSDMSEQKAFEAYVTDNLQLIAENTARAVDQGRYIKQRYIDLTKKEKKKEETRTGDEIINDMKSKMMRLNREGGENIGT